MLGFLLSIGAMTQDLPKSHACQVSEQLRCGDCKKPQTLCQSMFALSKDTTVQLYKSLQL